MHNREAETDRPDDIVEYPNLEEQPLQASEPTPEDAPAKKAEDNKVTAVVVPSTCNGELDGLFFWDHSLWRYLALVLLETIYGLILLRYSWNEKYYEDGDNCKIYVNESRFVGNAILFQCTILWVVLLAFSLVEKTQGRVECFHLTFIIMQITFVCLTFGLLVIMSKPEESCGQLHQFVELVVFTFILCFVCLFMFACMGGCFQGFE